MCVSRCRVPFRVYLVLALSMLASNGLGNASLAYLNYPTKVGDLVECLFISAAGWVAVARAEGADPESGGRSGGYR